MSCPDKPKQFCSFTAHKSMAECLWALDKTKNLSDCDPACFCLEMKGMIIKLRRDLRDSATFNIFDMLVRDRIAYIAKNFNSRWLVSILDTYVDHGNNILRRNAMIVSTLVTWERFCQTALSPCECSLKRGFPDYLYDGLLKYGLMPESDTHINMFRRLEKLLSSTPCIDIIFVEIIKRMRDDPRSVLSMLHAAHPRNMFNDIQPFLRRHGHD